MAAVLQVADVRVIPLHIPMRLKFEHAAASRAVADPVLVRVQAAPTFDARIGWGETLAREYVTGESVASVAADVSAIFAPLLRAAVFTKFEDVVRFAADLPFQINGRLLLAARAAVELALLDLAGRAFGRSLSDAAMIARDKTASPPRYSGIVVGSKPFKLTWFTRAQRLYGLRDFKIKVAIPGWERRLEIAAAVLRRAIRAGRATLRADANGGWTLRETLEALPLLKRSGVCALEQPLSPAHDANLPELTRQSAIPIIADESLRTLDDADRLMDAGVRILNIRIAKNGGFLAALALARRAAARAVEVQLGCLVGETSILTAAGAAFLRCVPGVRFAEGAFGRWLLKGDVVRRPLQFGAGGLLAPPGGAGLGVDVDERLVARYSHAAGGVAR